MQHKKSAAELARREGRSLDCEAQRAALEGRPRQEIHRIVEEAIAAWTRALDHREAMEYSIWARHATRVNADLDGKSMVTDVLHNYAIRRNLLYDGPGRPRRPQPQRGSQ